MSCLSFFLSFFLSFRFLSDFFLSVRASASDLRFRTNRLCMVPLVPVCGKQKAHTVEISKANEIVNCGQGCASETHDPMSAQKFAHTPQRLLTRLVIRGEQTHAFWLHALLTAPKEECFDQIYCAVRVRANITSPTRHQCVQG